MQDAGISLERSAAVGEGQMELSCQSCMQQAVQYHITSTIPTSINNPHFSQQGIRIQRQFYAKELYKMHYKSDLAAKIFL